MKRSYTYIEPDKLDTFLSTLEDQPYGCIWDTNVFQGDMEMCERLVRTGCRVVRSIGPQADFVHDVCDEIQVQIEVIEGGKCEIDTRGSAEFDIPLSEAIEEMEICLFPEDDAVIKQILIIGKQE